jgi:hypothetical protein
MTSTLPYLNRCIKTGLIPKTCRRKALAMTRNLVPRMTLRSRRNGRIGGRTSDARRRKLRRESRGTPSTEQKPIA